MKKVSAYIKQTLSELCTVACVILTLFASVYFWLMTIVPEIVRRINSDSTLVNLTLIFGGIAFSVGIVLRASSSAIKEITWLAKNPPTAPQIQQNSEPTTAE